MSAQFMQLGPFFDQGVICGAAKLEHYEAGTSTLKNIYSDAAMTTTLPQPFVSDANGVFSFYADGFYKMVLKRSDGAVLHTWDNWKIIDQSQQTLSSGAPVPTGSNVTLGDATWAHWTGSTNVQTLTGSALFYWAMADGNFTLVHSASLILPDSRNRKVNSGDVLFFINEGSGVFRLGGHMEKEGGWKGRRAIGVAATATLAVPQDGDFIDVSGGTTITAIGVAAAGYRFSARFTGTGLNLTHNSTSMISPWGVDYRTIQNEILEFRSLGSGNWIFFSLNGPKEQTGQIFSWHSSTPPKGGLALDGGSFSSATYPGLFAVLGTTTLPDDQGRTEIMIDGPAGRITSASLNGANADTLGGTGGAQTHTLTVSEIPSHDHEKTLSSGGLANSDEAGASNTTSVKRTDFAVRSTGGGGAHSNTQPWIARYRYIRF